MSWKVCFPTSIPGYLNLTAWRCGSNMWQYIFLSLKLYPISSYFKIGYSQTANAFIQCCLKQQHLLAWCIHNVSTVTDTLTIYAKKNCGTSADNWFMASFSDEWTQWYSCGRLGTLQGEVLKNWTIFSYYEQHYWKFFFPWPWLVDFCFCLFFFWSVNAGPWTVPLWSLHLRNSWKWFWLGIRHVTTAVNSSSDQWWWCSGLLQVWKIKLKFCKNFSEFISVEIEFSWIQKPHHEFECCT